MRQRHGLAAAACGIVMGMLGCASEPKAERPTVTKAGPSKGDHIRIEQPDPQPPRVEPSGPEPGDPVKVSRVVGGDVSDAEATARIKEQIAQRIALNARGSRLRDVIAGIADATGLTILVNWRALEGAGITDDDRITLKLDSVRASDALNVVLDQVGGDLVPLGYDIQSGVLTVSTLENLGKYTLIRHYDIRDLLVQAPNFSEAPIVDPGRAIPEDVQITDQTLFSEHDEETIVSRNELMEQVMSLVRDTVDPDNWRNAGGLVSSMSEVNGVLIVNTTHRNHEYIEELLGLMEKSRENMIAIEVRYMVAPVGTVDRINAEQAGGDLTLTREAAAALQQMSTQGDAIKVLGTARTLLFNGQRVYVAARDLRTHFVDTQTPQVVAEPAAPAPKADAKDAPPPNPAGLRIIRSAKRPLTLAHAAGIVDVEATVGRNGQTITMTVRADRSRSNAAEGDKLPDVAIDQWRSTFRIADGGGAILSAGLDREAIDKIPAGHEVVLFVRATVVK